MRAGRALALVLMLAPWAGPLAALDLPQGARLLAERESALDSYALPVGPYNGETVPGLEVEGRILRRTYRIEGGSATTLQILAPLRARLREEGWEILMECEARDCGGFDFRFGTEIVPAPDMQVDIGDFRFLSAIRGDDVTSILVSGGRSAAWVQVIEGFGNGEKRPAVVPPPAPVVSAVATAEAPGDGLGAMLRDHGHAVLGDLAFETGAVRLGAGPFASLETLAGFLAEAPQARIAVVGHTDSVGSLEDNIALSRARARAVRDRLIEAHGADPARIEAEGMGYLAPVASNLTPEGREANRRVEAVLLSD